MDKKLINKRKAIFLLFASFLLLLLASLFHSFYNDFVSPVKLTEKIQKKILLKESEVDQLMVDLMEKIKKTESPVDFKFLTEALSDFDKKNITLFVFKSDSLIFWTDNTIQVEPSLELNNFDHSPLNVSNGWFDLRKKSDAEYTILGFMKIKMDYPYENDYLSNRFASYINIPDEIEIISSQGEHNIFSADDLFLFGLDYSRHATIPAYVETILALAFVLSYLLFLSALHFGYRFLGHYLKNPYLIFLGYTLDVLLVRFLLLYYNFPEFIDHAPLFFPQFFASSFWAPSLGDLFLNLTSLLAIGYVFFNAVHTRALNQIKSGGLKFFLANLFIIFIFLSFYWLTLSLDKLVNNSSFSYNLTDIASISAFSIAGFLCFSLYLFAFILFTFKSGLFLFRTFGRRWTTLLLMSGYFIIFMVASMALPHFHSEIFLFLALYFALLRYIENTRLKDNLFKSTVLFIILFSVYSTFSLNKSITEKEKTNRIMLAQDFLNQKDPIMEYRFFKAGEQMKSDSALHVKLKSFPFSDYSDYDNIIDLIYQSYFSSFSARSDVWLTLCDPEWVLDIQTGGQYENCYDYFNQAIIDFGRDTDFENLYYIDNVRSDDNYLGIIELNMNGDSLKLFVEIFNKYISPGIGFSELLAETREEAGKTLANYSYCRYIGGNQMNQFGSFFYPMNLTEYHLPDSGILFFNQEGYNHLYYAPNRENALLMSMGNPGFIDLIAPFSYISIFLGLTAFLFFIVFRGPGSIKLTPVSFKKQVQLSVTTIIIVSFLFVGIGSLYYITTLNHNKNIAILHEKSNSVLIELNHKLLKEEDLLGDNEGSLTGYLVKFSQVFFSDINVYDLNAQLMATSAKGIFRKGLASKTMNSTAFLNMHSYGKSLFIHNEKIGEYSFLSAYRPLRNQESEIIAYLNLPYFAKQDELTNEITTFLVAFINVYVILIAFSIYLALVISNYITKPIELIREKIGRLKLGNTAEKIEWKRQDEIGSLVEEYNRMVDELALSADRLAKSERESAWREMARQIAHEIKNPLTPMKLSVQYLQKAWDDKTPDWEERLKRFSNTIIEQINSLSVIASEFSDFARMPRSNSREIDLVEIIQNAIGLYTESSQVKFQFEPVGQFLVFADKEHLLRVFNNLIKNSIQAIAEPEKGLITIELSTAEGNHQIKFTDNGKGIPEEMKEKVFYPNFTTKSGGMGLGLAMVKSIIENAGGTIRFDSQEDEGTAFHIAIPKSAR